MKEQQEQPMTTENNKNESYQACINPIEDQRRAALKHYQEASSAVHHWSGFVEAAIQAYNPATSIEGEIKSKENIRLWNAIDGKFVEFDYLEEVLPWLKENFTDPEEGIHPDIESIEILVPIANVVVSEGKEEDTYKVNVKRIEPASQFTASKDETTVKFWKDKYKEANEFICDIGKLLGQDGLGFDDLSWSLEDFENAIKGAASKEKEYREALEEVDFYLSRTHYEKGKPVYSNNIGAGSILHKKIKKALNK